VQLSPDARWASVTARQKNLDENRDTKDVWLLSLQSNEARQFTRNGKSEHARWSPDGKSLLITREGQLWLYPLDGGEGRQLTSLGTGGEGGVCPADGRRVAFPSDVNQDCRNGGSKKQKTKDHERGPKGGIVNRLFARHWTEWKEGKRTHLFVQPVEKGPAKD